MAVATRSRSGAHQRPSWLPDDGVEFDNPFLPGTWLHDEFHRTVRQERDILILIDDKDADRGTGKTITSLQIANGMDQTEEGLTREKAFIEPERLLNAYHEQPIRSALVLDEAEIGAGHRDTQTRVNKALSEIVSTGRVEQKYLVANLPAIDFIDLNLRKQAKVWIMMLRRGRGLVHHLRREPYSGNLLKERKQFIEPVDIPRDHELRSVYRELTEIKRKHIKGERGEDFIPKSEHKKQLRKAVEAAESENRNDLIRRIYHADHLDLTQRDLATAVGLSHTHVGNITRGEV